MSLFSWFVLKHVRIIELQSQKPTSEGLPLPDACLTTCWELLKLKAKLVKFSKKHLPVTSRIGHFLVVLKIVNFN